MKAVVLAGGLGKRLKMITTGKPKVLVKIGNATLIEHNIKKLQELGIEQIAAVIGYKGEMVRELLGNVVTYYEQKEQIGTAHAFLQAKSFIQEPYFLGMNGDIFFNDSLRDFISLKPPALATYRVEDSRRYGRLEIKDARLISIHEKSDASTSGLINAGIYIFPREIFRAIEATPLSPRKEYEITDTIKMMIDAGWIFRTYQLTGFWNDIAYTSDITKAEDTISKKAEY